jgi:hypothetical protein
MLIFLIQWFPDLMLNNPDWGAIFAPQGMFLREGEMIRRTNLSRTLASIAQEGADALYQAGIDLSFLIFDSLSQGVGSHCGFPCSQSSLNWWHTFSFRFSQLFCQSRPRVAEHISR